VSIAVAAVSLLGLALASAGLLPGLPALLAATLLFVAGSGAAWWSGAAPGPGGIWAGIRAGRFTGRGPFAFGLAAALTGFYTLVYWFPAPLGSLVRAVDPLSVFLRGTPADHWFLYGYLYTIAVLVLGVRMLRRHRGSRYQQVRTASVMFFQLGFGFLIPSLLRRFSQPEFYPTYFWPLKPEYLLPFGQGWLRDGGSLGASFIMFAALMTFVVTPLLTWRYGKRWYCSWVCGCGALAETAGDPFRSLSDKSDRALRIEHIAIGVVTACIALFTGLLWANEAAGRRVLGDDGSALYYRTYGFFVGAVFSGVIGVGAYPLLGARVWCRFGCPMAAYLGVLQKFFSRFRISVNPGQCISCGSCSTYCEMGIDVRAYAEAGREIVRASCVGCGICADVCPRGVLRLESGPRQRSQTGTK
jgi:Pyruvate/2-oxoacid:ferredoxin oxidoreductase delta subunit